MLKIHSETLRIKETSFMALLELKDVCDIYWDFHYP